MKVNAELLLKGLRPNLTGPCLPTFPPFSYQDHTGREENMTYTYSVNRPNSIWRDGMGLSHASKSRKYIQLLSELGFENYRV